jgi:hypothetical protein
MSFAHPLGRRCGLNALVVLMAIGLLAAASRSTQAGVILIESDSANSTSQMGSFTGSIDYNFDAMLNSWTVLITLTNTNSVGDGGRLTGFIFNINSADPTASATLNSGTHPFQNAPNQGGQPIGGTYDAGAALGGNFQGGGPPAPGIAPGATGSFLFTVSATDAPALTPMSFITGPETFNFLVRFRGFAGGGSDKVPAVVVPGPTTLCGLACGVMLLRGRRRTS